MTEKVLIQIIDSFILSFEIVLSDRRSLSEQDVDILSKALTDLRILKQRKRKTNDEILRVVESVIKLFL